MTGRSEQWALVHKAVGRRRSAGVRREGGLAMTVNRDLRVDSVSRHAAARPI